MKRLLSALLTLCLLISALPLALAQEETALTIDMTKWQYNADDGVYWQVGIAYCASPADLTYETLGIFVPQAYMDGVDNGDGTYTCTVHSTGEQNGYTAATAPIVMPVETPGYAAMAAPTGYVSSVASYTDAGFVYLYAGCRGRDAGAPAGVTDLKAAIRFYRSVAELLPGDTERIFTFGMSGGGAQSALMGATGDSELYTPYLEAIGAVEGYSDAVYGAMCWCPITNLDTADAAYEWNMGVARDGLDEEMQALSDALAASYVDTINTLALTDAEGNVLTLDGSALGVQDTGSYVDALTALVQRSLNHFLEDTTFPYTASASGGMTRGGMGGMDRMGGGRMNGDDLPDDARPADLPDAAHDGMPGDGTADPAQPGEDGQLTDADWANGRVDDGIQRNQSVASTEAATYETAEDYIAALNGDSPWIEYDAETNTATITSLAGFVKACKQPSKNVGAFDDLEETQGENQLFGYDGESAHFDSTMAQLLAGTEYEAAYLEDLARVDAMGNTVDVRVNMYNPMYYLCASYAGYQTANVASVWRIRTGINQGDTSLTTEMNLALALDMYGADVDFETVWAQGHTQAERAGTSTENFIAWVQTCTK